jgi:8-hydroxy-5-deazaflavin:NADPH oxidoreductase
MKRIGILGTGVVAQIVAEKLSSLGHAVTIGTRNVAETMAKTGDDMYGRPGFKIWAGNHAAIKVGTFAEAAAFGEVLVNATSGSGSLPALQAAGEANLNGKVLIDIANPLDFSKGFPPSLTVCNTDSLGEEIQRTWPQLRVVKTLNTMNAYVMVNPGLVPGDHSVFLNGNDAAAKAEVKGILGEIGWKETNIIDMGDITTARGTEMLLPIWVRLYGAFGHGMFNFHIAKGTPPQV